MPRKKESMQEIEVTPAQMDALMKGINKDAGPPMPLCTKEKLAICGTAPTLQAAPFEDSEYEIWAVAQCTTYPAFKRGDLLWEMHTAGYWRDAPILKRLNDAKLPIVMHDHYAEVPTSIRFPLEDVLPYRKYHTTSITYMLVWAYHSYKQTGLPLHVSLCGVHMEAREEYTVQRPACEYWLARMEEAGIDIFITGGAILAATGLYGYENYDPVCWKLRERIRGLALGKQVRENEERQAQIQKHEQIGAIKEAEHWLRLAQTGDLLVKEST